MFVTLASGNASGGYAAFALQICVALACLGVLAFLFVRLVGPRLKGSRPGGQLHLEERLPLDSRHTLFLVSALDKTLLLGGSGGELRLIRDWPATPGAPPNADEDER